MPAYEYECTKCNHIFVVTHTFAEHDRHPTVKCPKCKSTEVHQLISSIHLKTKKKS